MLQILRRFDKLIKHFAADPAKVLETVKSHLIEGAYDKQIDGLVNGLKNASPYKLKVNDIKKMIRFAKDDYMNADRFDEFLQQDQQKELLIRK